ncbi:MAG TPA: hypothetical protein PKM18_09670, partial [bacterium]|nr:hypothetical protein [bacterium]
MTSINVHNNEPVSLSTISFTDKDQFTRTVTKDLASGKRMIGLLPVKKDDPSKIIAVLADPSSSLISIAGCDFKNGPLEFESFANEYPHTNFFECELSEDYGFIPLNHPWMRPVRKQNVIFGKTPYEFYRITGEEIHE